MKKIILSLLLIASLSTYSQPRLVGTVHFHGPKYGGSIFRLDQPGNTPGTIYAFNNAVPHRPTGGVIAGNDNWLYGNLNYNGVNNNGGLYRIQRNGSNFSMLFNYTTISNPSIPIYHTDEFLYVVGGNQLKRYDPVGSTVSGNLADNVYSRNLHIDTDNFIYYENISSISKVQTDGTVQTFLHNFAYPGDGYDPIGVTEVPSNRLFGLHRLGGVSDGGTLFGVEKDGTGFSVHHIFTTATGVNPMSKLIYMDGKLFGTTNGGGDFGYGTLYSINADGTNFRVLYHFGGGVSGNISISSNGRIFGSFGISYQSGFNYYKMFKIDTSGQNFEPIFSIDQREGGDFNQDILLLNDEDIYLTTSEYGKHDGGTFNYCDTSGVGDDLHHFGLSPTGFRPTGGIIKASDGKLYGATVFGGTDGNGVVYSVNADGTNYAVLHQFTESEGYELSGKLLEASDGKLYGASRWGGSSLTGILYRINKNGTGFEVIFEFTGSDGYSPVGSLVEDAAGVLYGTCFYSSAVAGSVFKINKNGTGYSTLKLFSATGGDLGHPYNGLTLLKGYLYGACGYGGSEGNGGLFRIRTNGSGYQVLHDFVAADGQLSLPIGTPYIASNGKMYGTLGIGGPTGDGAVYSIDSVGTNFTILHMFSGFTEGSFPWGGMIQASDGLMYGSTQIGGSGGSGTIFRINLDGSGFTVIKSFNPETDGQGVGSTIIDLNGNFSLPVQWVKFTATKKEQSTLLSWQTASEQNSDRFEIERSSNGTIYNSIGTVASTNNPNGAQYTFQDNQPLTGINYYRLKQLDIDGKFEYSRVVQLSFDIKGTINIYPNPVRQWLNISVAGSQAIRSIVITDLNGKIVLKNNNLITSSISVRHLNAGAYLIRVETSQDTYVGKFVKQ